MLNRSLFSAVFFKRLSLLVGVLLLSACYPTYNWRELPVADGLATLAFPDKVNTVKRDIELAGMPVTFVLTSTEVNDTVFSIGWAQLPMQSTPEQRVAAQQALVDSLAASMGQAAPPIAMSGEMFRMQTQRDGQALDMVARVLVHYDVAMRVVATGHPDLLTQEVSQAFMRSLKLK